MKKTPDSAQLKPKPRYRILAPYLSFKGRDSYRGSVVNDLPAESVPWLLADGLIEAAPGADLYEAPRPASEGESH